MQRLLASAPGMPLPLPTDLPHCGRYETRYDMIFGGQREPAAEQLSQLMPLRYDQLRRESRGVAEALGWLAHARAGTTTRSRGRRFLRPNDSRAQR